MNRRYFDIIDRIGIPPVWWQEGGVPRYETFDVQKSTGVYAEEAALVEVMTQGCESTFVVLIESRSRDGEIAASIRDKSIRYGDPPNVDCCRYHCASMQAVPLRVIEYWRRGGPDGGARFVEDGRITSSRHFEWVRDHSLEGDLNDPFFNGGPAVPNGPRWRPEGRWRLRVRTCAAMMLRLRWRDRA